MRRPAHMLTRRHWMQWSAQAPLAAIGMHAWSQSITPARPAPPVPLQWPRDHGAHLSSRVEWWTLKGALAPLEGQAAPMCFHLAVLRSLVESAQGNPSRFSPRHVLAARVSLSQMTTGVQQHDQNIARIGFGLADAAEQDLHITLHDWLIARESSSGRSMFHAMADTPDFSLNLRCQETQPIMRHGENGALHRDPFQGDATLYYSLPQLQVQGRVALRGQARAVQGTAWLDHGWGRRMMAPDATGTDWVCINLRNGGALMVLRMRHADGSSAWEAATLREPGSPDRIFAHEQIRMVPTGPTWRSPATGGRYPLAWELELAGTRYAVRARLPNQEMDIGNGIGDVFWEGPCDLLDATGHALGGGYLEMTGYAGEMQL